MFKGVFCKGVLRTGGGAVIVDNKVRYMASRMAVVVVVHADFYSLCGLANWNGSAAQDCRRSLRVECTVQRGVLSERIDEA